MKKFILSTLLMVMTFPAFAENEINKADPGLNVEHVSDPSTTSGTTNTNDNGSGTGRKDCPLCMLSAARLNDSTAFQKGANQDQGSAKDSTK